MRRTVVPALLLALASVGCSPPPDGLAEFVAFTLPDTSGTVVAARGGEIVHCAGHGLADREAGVPATCDTVYDVMSLTKQFTAAAILELETMGELHVNDRIDRHLTPVPADKRTITLHHLLTHTAGLPDTLGDDYDVVSRDAMLTEAMAAELVAEPGAEFHYSNVGYSVLAAIVETVSGLGYEEFLSRYLFTPAGMTSTGYVLPDWDPDQVAVEYDAGGEPHGRPYEHPWAADGPYWNLRGNGGMLSTARDMFRWHRALLGDDVLPAPARAKLFTPHQPVPDSAETYAYGWGMYETDLGRVAWHNGGNSWSLANYARALDTDAMTFWVSNQAYRDDEWNLEDIEFDLTMGILERVGPLSGR
ncbi:serine hydrolase domain-containing protein [Actinophytocola gossypii]|uniref:Beta-lactamase family protein n=1 Tax=Actinophytocola gossypii TaxID=2812003 RepID=A0ABT2JK44_9PSEU|nr:serine hydrolase domain-containing protein [Actinophytocola gossypii]MCT2588071.1 beta-lactamase family protein [Actinophytocola gossypii]